MTLNNHIFKRMIAFTSLHRDEELTMQAFRLGGYHAVSKSRMKGWRTLDVNNHRYQAMPDEALTAFFDGLLQLSEQNIVCCYIEKGK